MDRRHFLTTSGLLLAGIPLLGRATRPTTAASFDILRSNIGYYTDRGGTIGVYLPDGRPEGGVVVDTQFADSARTLLETVEERGELARLSLLVNTHHHGDHTSGNGVLAPLAELHVAHERAVENLERSQAEKEAGERVPLPKKTFAREMATDVPGGEVVHLRHFGAAHTGGDTVVHFQNANVAHLGDLVFNRRFPYIDPEAGGSLTNWAEVLRDIRKFYGKDTLFLFGHAAEGYPVFGTHSDLRAMENYLRSLRKYVRKERRRGTSLEALQAKTVVVPGAPEWKYGERLRDVNLEVMWGELD